VNRAVPLALSITSLCLAVPVGAQEPPRLFESDMGRMVGFVPGDLGPERPEWSWMAMGLARLSYNRQGGPSGETSVESTNWNMVMAQRGLGRGRLTLMSMNSLEAATLPDGGTPELFQTGETFEGRPLVDRQHPHDLFMNLSVSYRRPVGSRGAAWLQLAPVGEPALGPVAFMHRASAGENPTSPLGHHWLDSSHITSTVLTAGGAWRRVTLEASAFHGEEPDEGRWDLDFGAPDSVAARVKLDLGRGWSAQVSHGFLKEPEALEPGDLRRTTASLHYGAAGDRPLAVSAVWGRNDEDHGVTDALLAEAAWAPTARDQVYARAERVEKDLELLRTKGLDHADAGDDGHGHDGEDDLVGPVGALTLGYLRSHPLRGSLDLGLGADVTVYDVPERVVHVYGENPVSVHVFARLRWGRPHGGHGGHGGH
jgi:hypothetical protein